MREGSMYNKNAKPDQQPFVDVVPALNGRPERDLVIGADDIVNLQIAINTASSLEDFLDEV